MPDYFNALIKQYSGALNDEQADRYAKAIIQAWYHSLPFNQRLVFVKSLPVYLRPKNKLFFLKIRPTITTRQNELVFKRISVDLQKTDKKEVEHILRGFFKTLKIISDQKQKFSYSKFLDSNLQRLFIEA